MISELDAVAQALVAPGKGILAADEAPGTLLPGSKPSASSLRPTAAEPIEMLFGAPGAAEEDRLGAGVRAPHRVRCNIAAAPGRYCPAMEEHPAAHHRPHRSKPKSRSIIRRTSRR